MLEERSPPFHAAGFRYVRAGRTIFLTLEPTVIERVLLHGRYRGQQGELLMKRLLLIGFAACTFAAVPIVSASAMPIATPNTIAVGTDSAVILARGGHGGGRHMRRGGHGHHYGWGRGRGHNHGWARGRHRGW
jgi:hypothetical protein